MLTKSVLGLFFACCCQILLADSLVCSSGQYSDIQDETPISCASPSIPITTTQVMFPRFHVFGNTITTSLFVHLDVLEPAPMDGLYYTAYARFNDTFALPSAKTGDVLSVNLDFASFSLGGDGLGGSAYQTMSLGPGNSSSPEIRLVYGGVVPYCEFHQCSYRAIVPADAYSFINLQGEATTAYGPALYPENSGVNYQYVADLDAVVSISRFEADGVTPDNFAPEPATGAIALVGLGAVILLLRRKKAQQN